MGSHTFSDRLKENMSKMKLLRLIKGMSSLHILSVELSSDLGLWSKIIKGFINLTLIYV